MASYAGSSSAPSWLWSTRAHPSFCLPPGCHLFNTSLTPPVTYFTSSSQFLNAAHCLACCLMAWYFGFKTFSTFAVQLRRGRVSVCLEYWTIKSCDNEQFRFSCCVKVLPDFFTDGTSWREFQFRRSSKQQAKLIALQKDDYKAVNPKFNHKQTANDSVKDSGVY